MEISALTAEFLSVSNLITKMNNEQTRFVMTANKLLGVIVLILTIFSASSCWYSFSERAFPNIESVGVIPFENETGEYELASEATDLLTQKLLSTSVYRLSAVDAADGVVSGRIVFYERKVNTHDDAENPIDYIVRLRASVTFAERATGRTLWQATFEGYSTFQPDGDENQAKQEAVRLLVEKIFDKMRSG